jgi:hypothetical protein
MFGNAQPDFNKGDSNMDQTVVNWMLAGFGGLIGFLLNAVWQAVKDLQKADKDLTAKVAEIEVLVAGAYVKKDDLEKLSNAIFTKLDRIEDKLDGKVDKP